MKISLYSIIPANVRYDRTLSDKSILLFGEINAAANAYGICDENNNYFSVALNVDVRTIARCIAQLVDQGHIQKIKENGRRRIKVIQRGLEAPIGVEIETDEIVPKEDITGFVQQLLTTWEKAVETYIDRKEMYTKMISQRLESFTKDELFVALKNRAVFINQSPWHREPENRQAALSIETLLKSDESVLKWLNAKVKSKEENTITPFKKN
jgi:hypothetical protein